MDKSPVYFFVWKANWDEVGSWVTASVDPCFMLDVLFISKFGSSPTK